MGIVDLGRATSYCVRDVAGLKTYVAPRYSHFKKKKKGGCKNEKGFCAEMEGVGSTHVVWREGKNWVRRGVDVLIPMSHYGNTGSSPPHTHTQPAFLWPEAAVSNNRAMRERGQQTDRKTVTHPPQVCRCGLMALVFSCLRKFISKDSLI